MGTLNAAHLAGRHAGHPYWFKPLHIALIYLLCSCDGNQVWLAGFWPDPAQWLMSSCAQGEPVRLLQHVLLHLCWALGRSLLLALQGWVQYSSACSIPMQIKAATGRG